MGSLQKITNSSYQLLQNIHYNTFSLLFFIRIHLLNPYMGRSQETFNKKEKEKKKLKKKQDKFLKKEERKANTDKGKSLDDMIAYVDEFGNITDTPPDPNQKKVEINVDEIEIGARKAEEVEPEELIRKGTITYFNSAKGFGFIKDHDSQQDVFVHINASSDPIQEGNKVQFETEKGPKGLNAINVKLI